MFVCARVSMYVRAHTVCVRTYVLMYSMVMHVWCMYLRCNNVIYLLYVRHCQTFAQLVTHFEPR